ncbi:MAG: T9SS type A sorting domain-containing protein [Lactococcus lactis]|jgi:hypothetical protein|nr:T9SS type A sorting domain-containing protein [Lactococcus lactis]
MKKVLFLIAANLISITFLAAQQNRELKTMKTKVVYEEKCMENVEVKMMDDVTAQGRKATSGNFNPQRANVKDVGSYKYTTTKMTVKKSEGSKDDPFFVGTMSARGQDYFDGWLDWNVQIRKDATDANKFWFMDFFPPYNGNPTQDVEIYATLSGSTLTFPLGQPLFTPRDGILVSLAGNEPQMTGSINATVNTTDKCIEFKVGVCMWVQKKLDGTPETGWYWLFDNGMTFTEPGHEQIYPQYTAPDGTLYLGLSNDGAGYAFNDQFGICAPYTTWTWENLNPDATATYLWQYNEVEDYLQSGPVFGPVITSNQLNLSHNVENEWYTFPTLTGTLPNNSSSSFQLNTLDYVNATIEAGGMSTHGSKTYHLTNANLDTWNNGYRRVDISMTAAANVDTLIALYEKPLTTLYFEGVDINVDNTYTAPTNLVFTLDIFEYERVNGRPVFGRKLASSRFNTSNIIGGGARFPIIRFDELFALDADGFETELPYLEVNTGFALKFAGQRQAGVHIDVLAEATPRGDGKIFHYFTKHQEEGLWLWNGGSFTFLFSLIEGMYTYILSSTDVINDDLGAGGTYDFTLTPMLNGAELESELPAWITMPGFEEHYVQGNWGVDVQIAVAALPAGTTGRSADLIFATWGSKVTVRVNQGDVVGITTEKLQKSMVLTTANGFELSYNSDFNKAVVYNLSGKAVATYNLPKSGKFTIQATNLNKGIYMIQLIGKTTETIKVVR